MPEYLVKTVNYTAKIKGDDELCHLAKVGTLQKDMLVREEPGGTWKEAKSIGVLMKFWGLEPVKASPRAIPRPEDAGTGISKITIEEDEDVSPFAFVHETAETLKLESKAPPNIPRLKTVIDYNPFYSEADENIEDDGEVTQYIRCEDCEGASAGRMHTFDESMGTPRHTTHASSADYQVVSSSSMVIEVEDLADDAVLDRHELASYINMSPRDIRESKPADTLEDFDAAATEPSLFDVHGFVDNIVRYEKENAPPPAPKLTKETPHFMASDAVRPFLKDADVTPQFSENPVAQAVKEAEQEAAKRAFEEASTNDFSEKAAEIRAWTEQKLDKERQAALTPQRASTAKAPPQESHHVHDSSEHTGGTTELYKKTHRIRKQRIADAARTIPRMRQSARELDVFLDEGDSEAFKVHSRSELDALMQAELQEIATKKAVKEKAKAKKERLVEHVREFEDEDESSDRLKIRTRSELRRIFKEENDTGEVDSISINMPMPKSLSNQNNLRNLFEEENELHIYLASEIREKESETIKEEGDFDPNRDHVVRPAHVESDVVEEKMPLVVVKDGVKPSGSRAEATKLTDTRGSEKSLSKQDSSFLDLFLEGESEIASFQNLCLTNERLWSVDIVKGSIQNYESYGLNSVQWVALKQEKHWEYVALNFMFIVGLALAYAYLMDIVTLMILIYAVVMLPVTYVFSYRTSLQVGLGNKVVKCSQRVTRDNRKRALKFLNSIERTAQSISRTDLKSKAQNRS